MDFSQLSSSYLRSKNLDHLGLVAGMCKELDIAGQIDELMPNPGCGKKISYGRLVEAMIINGLGFTSKSLYMVSDFFKDKAIDRLLGSDIVAEEINDDALGRTLDELHKNDVTNTFSVIAFKAYRHLGLKNSSLHLDSSSFHTDGAYAVDDIESDDVIKIVKGYSKDHRPDLNQCVLNLIIENQASIPLFMQAASGNTSDKSGFSSIVKEHIKNLQTNLDVNYFIADSALYTPESLSALNDSCHFITRVPEITNEAKLCIEKASIDTKTTIDENYSYVEYSSNYGSCNQRWFVIYSAISAESERNTLNKRLEKTTTDEQKLFNKLIKTKFDCQQDAQRSLDDFAKNSKALDVSCCHILEVKRKKSDFYKISDDAVFPLSTKERHAKLCGYFILATNQLDKNKVSAADILFEYKEQNGVERCFRFMKEPYFFTSSFYLKKPSRINALLMIMTLCLLVYAALEYRIREGLKLYGLFVLSQTKRKIQNPTAKWIFESFAGIHVIYNYCDSKNEIQSLILNLQDRQRIILQVLGEIYSKIYS